MNRVATTFLLTCAALGVAGGLILAPANWVSTALFAAVPFAAVAVAGLWLLPAVIALRLLRRPLAGLLVGLISGLVLVPFSGYGFGSVATNLWWAFFAELPFLLTLYRFWGTWMHYVGAAVVAIAYPILAAASFDLGTMPLAAQIGFFALTLGSCVVATGVGVAIGDGLRRAGVARLAQRRPAAPRAAATPPPPQSDAEPA